MLRQARANELLGDVGGVFGVFVRVIAMAEPS